jgi:hypothetical protein
MRTGMPLHLQHGQFVQSRQGHYWTRNRIFREVSAMARIIESMIRLSDNLIEWQNKGAHNLKTNFCKQINIENVICQTKQLRTVQSSLLLPTVVEKVL